MAASKPGPKELEARQMRVQRLADEANKSWQLDAAAKLKRVKLKAKGIGKLSTVKASKRGK